MLSKDSYWSFLWSRFCLVSSCVVFISSFLYFPIVEKVLQMSKVRANSQEGKKAQRKILPLLRQALNGTVCGQWRETVINTINQGRPTWEETATIIQEFSREHNWNQHDTTASLWGGIVIESFTVQPLPSLTLFRIVSGHFSECHFPNHYFPEWLFSWMTIFPNEHFPE